MIVDQLDLPQLAEVGGNVGADNGSITAPQLAEVGGNVWADNGSITAPLLVEVGGGVGAYKGSKIKLADNHKSNMGDSLRSKISASKAAVLMQFFSSTGESSCFRSKESSSGLSMPRAAYSLANKGCRPLCCSKLAVRSEKGR